ncbi:MAG: hypothetical protein E7619_04085 [Ruminococcaceae bacterium]|nr:hypothetical protein [Oscillospiraceae bacterium]
MSNSKATKRALLTSVLALVMCVSMLIGTTAAWFTDTVTSSGNKVISGTLKVDLEVLDETDNTTWYSVKDSRDPIFDYDNWEPGYVQVKVLKVVNEGSLALKWQATLTNTANLGKLADVIDVYVKEDVESYPQNRTDLTGWTKVGTLRSFVGSIETTTVGEIKPNDTKNAYEALGIAFKMQETAGNEYQDQTLGEFDIQILATQMMAEKDSFDEKYDEAAEYLNKDENGNFLIASAADLLYLAQEVNNGNSFKNETFVLTSDIDLGGRTWTPIGHPSHSFSALFDGNDHTVSNFVVDVEEYAGLFGDARNGGDIKNLTVKNAVISAHDRAGAVIGAGYTTLENCHAVDCVITVTPKLLANGNYDGGAKAGGVMGQVWEGAGNGLTNCTATNVTVIGYRDIGAVLGMAHNNNVVTDCKAYDSDVSYMYLGAGQVYGDGTPNENIGEVVGRVQSSATVTGSVSSNVKTNGAYVYGLKLVPNGAGSGTIIVDSKEALLNLGKLNAEWVDFFSNGLGTAYSNYAPQNGGKGTDYYYNWTWTVELTADIDFGGAQIAPIDLGKRSVFDGQDHTIKNAVIVTDPATTNEAGLFIGNDCGFKNLKLDNIQVTGSNVGNSTAGVLSGSCNKVIENVTVTNSSVTGGKYTGGVVGYGYTDVLNCTLTNVTVKGGYKLGGLIGYICASNGQTHDVTGNTLTNCTVDGIGGGVFAGGKTEYVIGKIVGNYNCDGTCNNNTVTNMTTSATANIGKIEAGKTVTE